MHTVKYFNLVGDEEDVGNERFKWSRASSFSYNRNAIGLDVAYGSAIRTHLLLHGTAHPGPCVPLLFALCQRLIFSSAALLTSLILVSKPSCKLVCCQWPCPQRHYQWPSCRCGWGGGNPSLVSSMPSGVVPGPVYPASALRRRAVVTTCLCKAKHHITAPLRVLRLIIPPLALTVSTRKPMYARMPPL